MTDVWFRIDDVRHASCDEYGDVSSTYSACYLRQYNVSSVTPKGVWLDVYGRKRFVLRGARKRFACPSFDEAVESFKARKAAQKRIYAARLKRADEALFALERLVSGHSGFAL